MDLTKGFMNTVLGFIPGGETLASVFGFNSGKEDSSSQDNFLERNSLLIAGVAAFMGLMSGEGGIGNALTFGILAYAFSELADDITGFLGMDKMLGLSPSAPAPS